MDDFEKYINQYKNEDQSDWVHLDLELDVETVKLVNDACEKHQVQPNIIISAILMNLIEKEKLNETDA